MSRLCLRRCATEKVSDVPSESGEVPASPIRSLTFRFSCRLRSGFFYLLHGDVQGGDDRFWWPCASENRACWRACGGWADTYVSWYLVTLLILARICKWESESGSTRMAAWLLLKICCERALYGSRKGVFAAQGHRKVKIRQVPVTSTEVIDIHKKSA